MKYLQKLGKALMVPVAVLPAAGILVGIGNAFTGIAAGTGIAALSVIANFIFGAGIAIIDNLPVLFAIGIAFGMSKGSTGAAAIAGFVAYTTVVVMLKPGGASGEVVLGMEVGKISALAFSKIGNALTGIISGIIAAALFNKFSKTQLPSWLSFFNGKRLVPILTTFVMMVYVLLMFFIWPVVFGWLIAFGQWMVGLSAFGAGLFGFFNRLLIPTGLHHALNNVFWFDTVGINDLNKFLDGGKNLGGIKGETGMYMAGFFPIMMFGLPAAAMAMITTAKPENREKTKGIMISAAVAAIVVGITEPIEFAFMFVAPVLYGVHAVLTGISMALAVVFEATAGFSFSAGLVDFVLSLVNPLANNIWILPVMGVGFAAIYFFLFRFLILKFNMKTPGREDDEAGEAAVAE